MDHVFRGRPTTAIFLLGALIGGVSHSVGEHATDFVITTFERPIQTYSEGVLRSGCCGGDSSFKRGDLATVFR